MPDETKLIERMARAIPSFIGTKGRAKGVPVGIGDDAMVGRTKPGFDWVVTVDAFVEDIHFWVDRHPPDSVGYKALARATSDLAAMGATPHSFLLTLALPRSRTGKWLDGFSKGMGRAARSLGLVLVGGDTTRSDSVFISLTVFGEVARGRAVTRSGARPGDVLFVSGALGRAQLGLELVRHGQASNRRLRDMLQPHLYPRIRLQLGEWLATHGVASAMMDLSDGLSSDLARMCAASCVGAVITAEKIPCVEIPDATKDLLGKSKTDPLQMALHGGEDYELLFTVPESRVAQLRGAPGFKNLRAIGEICRGKNISVVGPNGKWQSLSALGWDPFRTK